MKKVKIWNENCNRAGNVAPDDAPEGDTHTFTEKDIPHIKSVLRKMAAKKHYGPSNVYEFRRHLNALKDLLYPEDIRNIRIV